MYITWDLKNHWWRPRSSKCRWCSMQQDEPADDRQHDTCSIANKCLSQGFWMVFFSPLEDTRKLNHSAPPRLQASAWKAQQEERQCQCIHCSTTVWFLIRKTKGLPGIRRPAKKEVETAFKWLKSVFKKIYCDFIINIDGSLLTLDFYENWLSIPDGTLAGKINGIQRQLQVISAHSSTCTVGSDFERFIIWEWRLFFSGEGKGLFILYFHFIFHHWGKPKARNLR